MSGDRLNVVIVGGGVIGCGTAYYLARAGAHVTVLERGPLCGEASSSNGSLVTPSIREGLVGAMALESMRLMDEAKGEIGIDFELRRGGSMTVLRTEEELRQRQGLVDRQRRAGLEMELVDRETALKLEPRVDPDILGATLCPEDATVNPHLLTFAFATGARRLGATIRTGVEVRGLKAEGGRIRSAVIPEGEVAGDLVVVAAGAWVPAITRTVGLDVPIEPSRGQMLITEPISPITRRTIKELGAGAMNVAPTARGNYIIGSLPESVGFNKQLTVEKLNYFVRKASALVPGLGNVRIMRAWAGLRPISADSWPLLGPVAGYEGLVLAAGHSRTGICYSAVTCKMVADLLTTGRAAFPLEPFSPIRFKTVV